jgi:desampylase
MARLSTMPDVGSSGVPITIAAGLREMLLAEAQQAHPAECCGLLLGKSGAIESILPAANVAADPLRHFEIDPVTLLDAHRAARAGGPAVIGYYHSHPQGPARPSATDREHSTGDLRIWAIVADAQVAFWRDTVKGFESVACREADG